MPMQLTSNRQLFDIHANALKNNQQTVSPLMNICLVTVVRPTHLSFSQAFRVKPRPSSLCPTLSPSISIQPREFSFSRSLHRNQSKNQLSTASPTTSESSAASPSQSKYMVNYSGIRITLAPPFVQKSNRLFEPNHNIMVHVHIMANATPGIL